MNTQELINQIRLLRDSDYIPDADQSIDSNSGLDIEPYHLLDFVIDALEDADDSLPYFREDGKERDPLTGAQLQDIYPE
jgi:hypothetical protein